jgi:plastocyanin
MDRFPAPGLIVLIGALPCLGADEDKWSTVKGRVLFDDTKNPIPKRVIPPGAKGANLPPCAAQDKEFLTEDWIVDPKTKGVKNVMIWLGAELTEAELKARKEKPQNLPPFPAARVHPDLAKAGPKTHSIDQPCCRFEPHVLIVRAGDHIEIKNSASFVHNAWWKSFSNGEFNETIRADGGNYTVKGVKPEKGLILIDCSIHPWMRAYVKVIEHPYFALTNEKGEFQIEKVPVGKCRIVVYHEDGLFTAAADGRSGEALDVKPKDNQTRDFKLTAAK